MLGSHPDARLWAKAGAAAFHAGNLREASAVQTLTSPSEMGESFKVLALSRGDHIAWPGFAFGDRSHRL